jgi:DNA-binding CsgD family transcriptional regulator
MDVLLPDLSARLRGVDTFAALAAALIDHASARPGVLAVTVEAHDDDGPFAWFGRRDGDDIAVAAAERYLATGGAGDPLLARARDQLAPCAAAGELTWLCPIVGCGALAGAIRLRVTPGATVQPWLGALCTLASVRVAELGGPRGDVIGTDALTARQYEVTVLVARGSTNAEIARLLAISPDAVKKHVSRTLAALEVSNRAELAALASRWRWTAPVDDSGLRVVLRGPASAGLGRLRTSARRTGGKRAVGR